MIKSKQLMPWVIRKVKYSAGVKMEGSGDEGDGRKDTKETIQKDVDPNCRVGRYSIGASCTTAG